jgi:hypothetical protein
LFGQVQNAYPGIIGPLPESWIRLRDALSKVTAVFKVWDLNIRGQVEKLGVGLAASAG